MSQGQHQPGIEPGQEVEIGLFRPEDAPGVAACFRAVYGEGYPVKTYYHPRELIAAVQRGQIIPVVARTPRGEVVGVVNMFNSAPFKGVYEVGAGLVLPSYRERRLNHDMIGYLLETAVPLEKVPMGYGEAVLNHVYQQKTQHAMRYVATALEVDLMPAAAYSKEKSATGRVAAMMAFRSYQPHARQVTLPPRYAAALREIYAGIDLQRTFLEADPGAALQGVTELEVEVFDFASAARVTVREIGADLTRRMDDLLAEMRGRGVVVIQVWLNLASPLVAAAVEVLRPWGFFLGGPLPRWFDEDGLLMQKVPAQPNWRDIKIQGQQNQRIFDLVRQDWQELQGGDPAREGTSA
ncbi:MAG: hypothetical protein HY910_02895 [Desulfarculus sp.]|nr:hypothetical protein [Desulfarculus sp.]